MCEPRLSFACDSPEATHAAARRLAAQLAPGDAVLLSGNVGAGKTHFARGAILSLLDPPEDVPSPTFTLVQTYDGRTGSIWHADLYRLTDISELEELGLDLAFQDAISFVEWPDRLGPLTPPDALFVDISAPSADDTRILSLSWSAPKWADRLEAFQDG